MLEKAGARGERARMELNLEAALRTEYRSLQPDAMLPTLKAAWSRAHVTALMQQGLRLSRSRRKPFLESIVASFTTLPDAAREGIFRRLSSFSSDQQKQLATLGLKDRNGRVRHATAEAALKNRIQTEYLPILSKSTDKWIRRAYQSYDIKMTSSKVYKEAPERPQSSSYGNT